MMDHHFDPTPAQAELAKFLFKELQGAENRLGIGDAPGAEADLRLMAACLRAVREPERIDDILREYGAR